MKTRFTNDSLRNVVTQLELIRLNYGENATRIAQTTIEESVNAIKIVIESLSAISCKLK